MKILLVEDEVELQNQLAKQLRHANYGVEIAGDGEEGFYMAAEYAFDLAVIDLGLPKLDGVELIKKIRQKGISWPILVLTARDSWQDKVEGLEAGGDDYVTKPFQVEEVLARINALLRRSAGLSSTKVERGPIVLDTRTHEVKVSGRVLSLTAYEYRVLEYLMLHPDEVVSKTVLTEHIYEQDFERDSNVIEVFIGRLRKKIDPQNQIKPIETLRGRGYRLKIDEAP